MPRLIKLSSGNNTIADFQNFFTEDILLKPNSKVALYNLSLTLNERVFEVNLTNYNFQVQNKGGNPPGGLKNVSLRVGTYNKASFLIELTRAINSAFSYLDGSANGDTKNEWKPIYMPDSKLQIQYSATINDLNGNIKLQAGNFAFAGANNSILTKTATDATWDSCYTSQIFTNGVGIIEGCINNNTNNGVCIGLINDISNGLFLQPPNYYACIFVDAGVYKFYHNGNLTITATAPVANDTISIKLELGLLSFILSRPPQPPQPPAPPGPPGPPGPNVETVLSTVTYEYNQILHGAVSFYNTNNAMSNITFTPSPYQNFNVSGVSLVQRNEDLQDQENYLQFDNLGGVATVGTIHRLVLTAASAELLGFTTLDNSHTAAVTELFQGERVLTFGRLAGTLTIELPSLDLSGYDGEVHRRRNILAILPAEEEPGVQRDYQAVYPIYIDINNKQEQLLNTIQCRILDESGTPVNLSDIPGVIMSILLD